MCVCVFVCVSIYTCAGWEKGGATLRMEQGGRRAQQGERVSKVPYRGGGSLAADYREHTLSRTHSIEREHILLRTHSICLVAEEALQCGKPVAPISAKSRVEGNDKVGLAI